MQCDRCLYRLECVLDVQECAITAIDDDITVGDEMPHPTEIEFNLKAQYAKFIGDQLLVWVDEKTLRALAAMRKMDHCGTDQPDEAELQGYMGKVFGEEVSICFVTKTPEDWDEYQKRRGCSE